MVPPGPRGYIDGVRLYFFSRGQSIGPTRSSPWTPSRAASRQQSSMLMSRPKTPRVMPCLRWFLRWTLVGGLFCELLWASAKGATNTGRKSLRRILHLQIILLPERIRVRRPRNDTLKRMDDDSPRKTQWWLIATAAVLAVLTLFYYHGSWVM